MARSGYYKWLKRKDNRRFARRARQSRLQVKFEQIHPNRINREFEEHGPGNILLTDITCLKMLNGKFSYLSTIKDAYTKQIFAYRVSDSLSMDFVMETMNDLKQNHGEDLQPNFIIQIKGYTALADILPMKWTLEKNKTSRYYYVGSISVDKSKRLGASERYPLFQVQPDTWIFI